MAEFRHFRDRERNAINWADPKVVIIEVHGARYANKITDKLELLKANSTQLVGWPGASRQDVFELDDETRAIAINEIEKYVGVTAA